MSYLINFVLFQVAWFAGILGAAHQMASLGVAVILLCLGIHFGRLPKHQIKNEALLVARCLALGFVVDSILLQAELMTYASAGLISGISPLWMCLLWAALAITLNHSMSWIKRSYWLAAILGSITGPLSYLAGVKLGAGTMPNQSISLIALGLIWAMAMPLMVKWSKLATEKI
ncbi:MAG: hypothetical protein RI905_513 [Pseudomonadota bacterium]